MSYWYLATVYSKHPDGIDAAHVMACRAAADLIRAGIPVFSPIAHTHPIAIHGAIDPLDHSIWLPADAPMMAGARGLIVYCSEGWRDSYGIGEEIKAFTTAGKSIVHMTPTPASPNGIDAALIWRLT